MELIVIDQGGHNWSIAWDGPGWYAPYGGLNGGDTVQIAKGSEELTNHEVNELARRRGRGTPSYYETKEDAIKSHSR